MKIGSFRPIWLAHVWWLIFLVEIPIVLGTCLFAMLLPNVFLSNVYDISHFSDRDTLEIHTLLHSYIGVTYSMIFLFYLLLLTNIETTRNIFRNFQICLLVGDVWIIVLWISNLLKLSAMQAPFSFLYPLITIFMASFWGIVRIIFLKKFFLF